MSVLGLMVKQLNRVEDTIDQFDEETLNVASFLSKFQEEFLEEEPNQLEVVEVIGSVLMSMMLPGLIVATFFLVIKVAIAMGSKISFKILSPILDPIKYKKLNRISLSDPEMLAVRMKPKKTNRMFAVQVVLSVLMVMAVFVIFLGHCYVWNKWGANIDSAEHFIGETPLSLRELHGKMSVTMTQISEYMGTVKEYIPVALEQLGQTSPGIDKIILGKVDRVIEKGADFSVLAGNLDSFVIDSDNKTLSVFLSLCYVVSCVVSMWFWFLIISFKFEHNIGWFLGVVCWCSTFLSLILINIYSTLFIPYLITLIQKDSAFILNVIF